VICSSGVSGSRKATVIWNSQISLVAVSTETSFQ